MQLAMRRWSSARTSATCTGSTQSGSIVDPVHLAAVSPWQAVQSAQWRPPLLDAGARRCREAPGGRRRAGELALVFKRDSARCDLWRPETKLAAPMVGVRVLEYLILCFSPLTLIRIFFFNLSWDILA